MKIGFIGIGVMGTAMATHLLAAGHELFIYNRTKSKADSLIQKGAIWCEDVQTVATQSSVIFTIIGMPSDVEAVYLGEQGLIQHAKAKSILIDMTTSSPGLAKKIAEVASEKEIICLDAPVTGGDIGAKNGTLTMMVGGDKQAFDEIQNILALMATTIVYMGDAGSGQHAKMANQVAISGAVLGMAESLSYAKQANLNLESMLKILTSGSAASWQLQNMGPRVLNHDYEPGFYIKHFIKDMSIALAESKQMNTELAGLALVLSIYQELQANGDENLGTQGIFKYYEN